MAASKKSPHVDASRPAAASVEPARGVGRTAVATRSTSQGAAVKKALRDHDSFRSAQDIYAALRSDGQRIGLATVYRRLQSLEEDGLVDVIRNTEGESVYRLCGEASAAKHHHHLVCRQCGATEEIEGTAVERWLGQVAADHGYSDVDHTLEVFGLCPNCSPAGR